MQAELAAAHERVAALEAEAATLRAQLQEATKLIELQRADIERYKAACERIRPNTPERVPKDQLQLAFAEVLKTMSDLPAAKTLAAAAANDNAEGKTQNAQQPAKKKRHPHGRRQLDIEGLPVEDILVDPDEVVAAGGEGFELIGEEVSERIAFKPSSYVRLRITRRKWARAEKHTKKGVAPVVMAKLPDSVWPSFLADPSAVAADIIGKYDDYLPLNRQEKISERNGFRVPRSTQCSWLGEAYSVLYRIPAAMFAEAVAKAFCIATDATGAPVRMEGSCASWPIFVFIADHDHVIFRYAQENTSEVMKGMLGGYHGHLLADAAPVYDTLHRDGAIEVGCWFHLRRYLWRGMATDPPRALQVLSLIAKLFEIERDCRGLPLPEYTARRAAQSTPVLEVFDEWVNRNRKAVDPRGPLDQGMGYYENQKEALRRFLTDGRLRLDNSISEQQLRNAVLGRHNWMFFANETGLKWYTTFRSLIASCRLHGLNAHEYLEQVLRLAPHWPVSRVLELSPKYWRATVAGLDEHHQRILIPPWQTQWPVVEEKATPQVKKRRMSA